MGWATGSSIMGNIVGDLEDSPLSHTQRVLVYEILIDQFENYDCDTLDECVGADPAFDEAMVNTGHEVAVEDEDDGEWNEDDE